METLLDVPSRGSADRQEGPNVSGLTGSLVHFYLAIRIRIASFWNCSSGLTRRYNMDGEGLTEFMFMMRDFSGHMVGS